MTLRARTRWLDSDVDLIEVAGQDGFLFQRNGVGLAGIGEAIRIDVQVDDGARAAARIAGALAEIDLDDSAGVARTPIAFGALPFRRDTAGTVVVPELVVGRQADGRAWELAFGTRGTTGRSAFPGTGAGDYSAQSMQPPAEWMDTVDKARSLLTDEFRKVVLARPVVVTAGAPIGVEPVLRQLARDFPTSTTFAVERFVGASPELLVARDGEMVRSHPLAGTTARSDDPDEDAALAAALLASEKDQLEHRITIDMVYDALLPWCSYLDWEAEPSIVRTASVQHLGTSVEGKLSTPPPSVVEMMAALHPTPAVCGQPRDRALEVIEELEVADRGRYAGPVGWVDVDGNGEWVVGIRSAEIVADKATLWAGVGVVPDSDPEAELAETRAKFETMLSALIRP
jgi:menaquinone-specific isochorismate synthase